MQCVGLFYVYGRQVDKKRIKNIKRMHLLTGTWQAGEFFYTKKGYHDIGT